SHVRVTVELDGPSPNQLYFRDVRRFGRFLVLPSGEYHALPTLAYMGPEPLDEAFTAERLALELQRSRAPVKAWLMSQRPVAGVGNIYVDEALWRAGIHPRTPARKVARSRIGPLRDAIVDLLTAAIAAKGTTFSSFRNVAGEAGAYVSRLDVYGRAGEPCRRCSKALSKAVIGQRTSVFCTRCQRR
ncbi:MAG TPA: DNA-formamidopyrimidine glycosylase, partial [Polyangiaceae bacterium]|nr:DNA-formamidopyrimidine glycosylase [Polyangiaceae bacterium]